MMSPFISVFNPPTLTYDLKIFSSSIKSKSESNGYSPLIIIVRGQVNIHGIYAQKERTVSSKSLLIALKHMISVG